MIERSGTRLVAVVGLVALCSTQAGLALAADGPSAPAAPPAPPAAEPTSEQQAKDKLACVSSYEDAQRLRLANKLLAAREQLRVCRGDVCPGLVRNDCEKWLGEVAESLPSVVLSARDGGGRDLFDVKVTIDGAPLRAGLDGTAVDVDPGAHTIVFVRGSDTKEERVLVRQGEHNRVVVGVLGRSPAAAPLPAPAPAPASTQPPLATSVAPARGASSGSWSGQLASSVSASAACSGSRRTATRASSTTPAVSPGAAPKTSWTRSSVDAPWRASSRGSGGRRS